jgi:hypothetical protein
MPFVRMPAPLRVSGSRAKFHAGSDDPAGILTAAGIDGNAETWVRFDLRETR